MAENNNSNNSTVNSTGANEEKRKEKKKGKKVNVKTLKNVIQFIAEHIVVIGYIALALLIIIFVIGILQILITMPGLILGKLKEFCNNVFGKIAGYFNGDDITITVDQEGQKELANYIEEMGYDIVGFGFGDATYTEAQADENTGPVEKTIESLNEGDEKKGVRGYLKQYMIATTATYVPTMWNWSGFFTTIFSEETAWDKSKGMINITEDRIPINNGRLIDLVKSKQFEILPDEKAIRVKTGAFLLGDQYYFDMTDWAAKYGKPMELFLALHLSTMMPDLAYDLATSDAFNTKVDIDFQYVSATYSLEYQTQNGDTLTQDDIMQEYVRLLTGNETSKTGDELIKELDEAKKSKDKIEPKDWDIGTGPLKDFDNENRATTRNQLDELIDLIKDGSKQHEVRWPRITEVTKHWYYNTIKFEYGKTENLIKDIPYEAPDDGYALYGVHGIVMKTSMPGYYQLSEPDRTGPNDAIVNLFLNNKYYRYDGTKDTAKKINEARALDNGGRKYLFEGKEYDAITKKVSKEKVVFYDANNQNSYKNAFTAFAMLEKAHTEEAELSYRCLKELLVKLDYFTEEELKDPVTQVLAWVLPDNTLARNRGRDANLYGLLVKGNNSGHRVAAPGDAKIIAKDDNSITLELTTLSKTVMGVLEEKYHIGDKNELQLNYIDENEVVGMQMVIEGIKPKENLNVGDKVYAFDVIGNPVGGNVQIYLKNADGSIEDEIEKYIDVDGKVI